MSKFRSEAKKLLQRKRWNFWVLKSIMNWNLINIFPKSAKKAANQLSALYRLGKYLNLQQREVLVKSFILANFDYCPMVWHFCSCKNTAKIERIRKRALKFMLNDFTSDYETLMAKANTSKLKVRRLRSICTEIYKTATVSTHHILTNYLYL